MTMFASMAADGRRPVRLAVLTAALGVVACFGAAFTFADQPVSAAEQVVAQ